MQNSDVRGSTGSGSAEEEKKQDAKAERASGKSGSVEEIGFGVALQDKGKDGTGEARVEDTVESIVEREHEFGIRNGRRIVEGSIEGDCAEWMQQRRRNDSTSGGMSNR